VLVQHNTLVFLPQELRLFVEEDAAQLDDACLGQSRVRTKHLQPRDPAAQRGLVFVDEGRAVLEEVVEATLHTLQLAFEVLLLEPQVLHRALALPHQALHRRRRLECLLEHALLSRNVLLRLMLGRLGLKARSLGLGAKGLALTHEAPDDALSLGLALLQGGRVLCPVPRQRLLHGAHAAALLASLDKEPPALLQRLFEGCLVLPSLLQRRLGVAHSVIPLHQPLLQLGEDPLLLSARPPQSLELPRQLLVLLATQVARGVQPCRILGQLPAAPKQK
jgi:hypothetical protein